MSEPGPDILERAKSTQCCDVRIDALLGEAIREIAALRARLAALVEVVREGNCPADDRVTVGECQQCGCSLGLLTGEAPESSPRSP